MPVSTVVTKLLQTVRQSLIGQSLAVRLTDCLGEPTPVHLDPEVEPKSLLVDIVHRCFGLAEIYVPPKVRLRPLQTAVVGAPDRDSAVR